MDIVKKIPARTRRRDIQYTEKLKVSRIWKQTRWNACKM